MDRSTMNAEAPPRVILYAAPHDPYGVRAKTLLRRKGVAFSERPLPAHREEMERLTGAREGPQVLIDGKPIGGFDALGSLELRGELDGLLEDKP